MTSTEYRRQHKCVTCRTPKKQTHADSGDDAAPSLKNASLPASSVAAASMSLVPMAAAATATAATVSGFTRQPTAAAPVSAAGSSSHPAPNPQLAARLTALSRLPGVRIRHRNNYNHYSHYPAEFFSLLFTLVAAGHLTQILAATLFKIKYTTLNSKYLTWLQTSGAAGTTDGRGRQNRALNEDEVAQVYAAIDELLDENQIVQYSHIAENDGRRLEHHRGARRILEEISKSLG